MQKINGVVSATQNLTGDLQFYVCYAKSPNALTMPNPSPSILDAIGREVNIQITENLKDQSQQNFEYLLMTIGLRAQPVVICNPFPVADLRVYTPDLCGEGFVWKFAVERGVQFFNFTQYGAPGPVGLLVNELDGLMLPSGVRITTVENSPTGWEQNVVFALLEEI